MRKVFPGGRFAEIYPLLFGRARLGVGRVDDPTWYDDEW